MATRLHRSVLAHETAHALFKDTPSRFEPVNAKQERRADEWAATRLITLDDYRSAEALHGNDPEAIALELTVTTDLIDAYRRRLLRIADTVYLKPREGVGQWLHREDIAT